MSQVEQLKKLKENLPVHLFVEIIDCIWEVNDSEICWNTENNLEDLEQGNGKTYSSYMLTEFVGVEEYLSVEMDNGCGETLTGFFHKDKRVEFDQGDI